MGENSQKVLSSEPFPKLTMTHTWLSEQLPDIRAQTFMSRESSFGQTSHPLGFVH